MKERRGERQKTIIIEREAKPQQAVSASNVIRVMSNRLELDLIYSNQTRVGSNLM